MDPAWQIRLLQTGHWVPFFYRGCWMAGDTDPHGLLPNRLGTVPTERGAVRPLAVAPLYATNRRTSQKPTGLPSNAAGVSVAAHVVRPKNAEVRSKCTAQFVYLRAAVSLVIVNRLIA